MKDYQRAFLDLALSGQALRFGQFQLKSGRLSPYFFNTGLFNTGAQLLQLARYYAQAIVESGIEFDQLYGPAYKGIPLVAATAMCLAEHHARNLPYSFNRKEAKQHGEGGMVVGHPLQGRIIIVDDVISAGTSVRESVEVLRSAGATPVAVAIAIDRQERGVGDISAVQAVEQEFGLRVIPIATLATLLEYLKSKAGAMQTHYAAIEAYRAQYGI